MVELEVHRADVLRKQGSKSSISPTLVTVDVGLSRHRCSKKLFYDDLEHWICVTRLVQHFTEPLWGHIGYLPVGVCRCSWQSLRPPWVTRYVPMVMCHYTMTKKILYISLVLNGIEPTLRVFLKYSNMTHQQAAPQVHQVSVTLNELLFNALANCVLRFWTSRCFHKVSHIVSLHKLSLLRLQSEFGNWMQSTLICFP